MSGTRILLGAIGAALGLLSCNYGGSTGYGGPPSQATVTLNTAAFSPQNRTLAAGGTVTWTWASDDHNVLSTGPLSFPSEGAPPPAEVVFDSPHSYAHTFPVAGNYDYYCSFHGTPASGMRGTIMVQ